MQRSFHGNSPARTLPQLPLSQIHLEQFPTYKHVFSEVTIQTNDEDVPFIALFKPNVHVQKQRNQAASKIALITKGIENMRLAHAHYKMLTLGSIEKLHQAKTVYFAQLFERMIQRRMQKAIKSLVVNKVKKGGSSLSAKIVWKIQNNIFSKNVRDSFETLVKHKLLSQVRQLSHQNILAQQLKSQRADNFNLREEAFSQQFVSASKALERPASYSAVLTLIEEKNFREVIKSQLKRFEQVRQQKTPRRKDHLNNEVIASVIFNLIGAFQQSTQHYQGQMQQLQISLNSYQDTQGINELNEVIRQRDNQLSIIQAFIAQLSRMDNELHKFTLPDRFQVDRINSTVNSQTKKLEMKQKNLEGEVQKISVSRTYNNSIITTLVSKIEDAQRQRKDAETAVRQEVRQQLQGYRECKRQLQALKVELNQERMKLSSLIEKKQVKRGLEELKRKWKGHEQLKVLLEYLIVLHQRIQELERQQQLLRTYEKDMSDGVQQLTNYVDQGVQTIKETDSLPKFIPPNRLKDESLKVLRSSIQKMVRFLLETSRQRQQLLQSSVRVSYQSQAETVKPKTQNSSKLQRSGAKIRGQVKDEGDWLKVGSESIVRELKSNLQQFKIQLHKSHIHETEDYQSIQTSLNRIEDLLHQYKEHFDNLNKQLAQNNNMIQKLLNQKSEPPIQRSTTQKQGSQQNEAIQFKLYQDQISRLKSEIQQSIVSQRKESSKQRQESKSLLNKILQLQKELLQKTNQPQQEDESPALLRQLRERMLMLQTKIDLKRDVNRSRVQDSSVSNALSRIQELMDLLRQSENNVAQLTNRNNQISQTFQEKRFQYQEQIRLLQSQLSQKQTLLRKEIKNMPSSTDRNQQLVSKNFQLQEEIIRLRYQLQTVTKSQESHLYKEAQEQNKAANQKISHLQIELTRKNSQIDRVEHLLRQTQTILTSERQKSSYLQSEIRKVHIELDHSHHENERIASETKEEIRKITLVLKSMEQELDKKTKQFQQLNYDFSHQQELVNRLRHQNNNYHQQLREALTQCNQLQQKNSSLYGQLAHIKADFYSLQVELTSDKTSKLNENDHLLNLQSQIKGKDEAISNILERSKAQSTSLNQQIYEAKEQLLAQERKYEEQLSLKNALINRLEHSIVELQTNLRMLEQRCQLLEKNANKIEVKVQKSEAIESRDRQIEYLHQQISSLQSFLSDMSHEYKQLENKYHQEKRRFGTQYDYSKHQNSLEQIDRAIHSLGDASDISEQVKSLIYNNEQLQINVEELQDERKKLLDKARSQPERQYVVELLFNILLGAKKLPPQSQTGGSIWNQLVHLNQRCQDVGELFTQLEKFSLCLLSPQS